MRKRNHKPVKQLPPAAVHLRRMLNGERWFWGSRLMLRPAKSYKVYALGVVLHNPPGEARRWYDSEYGADGYALVRYILWLARHRMPGAMHVW